jgi:hypothetical protein
MNTIHKDTGIDWKKSEFSFYRPRKMGVLQDIVSDQFHGSRIEYSAFSDKLQESKLPWSSLTSVVERQLLLF